MSCFTGGPRWANLCGLSHGISLENPGNLMKSYDILELEICLDCIWIVWPICIWIFGLFVSFCFIQNDLRFLDPLVTWVSPCFSHVFCVFSVSTQWTTLSIQHPWTGWGGAWLHLAMFPHKRRRSGINRSNVKVTKKNIPSGKRLHSNGKSPFLMGKSTINGHSQ